MGRGWEDFFGARRGPTVTACFSISLFFPGKKDSWLRVESGRTEWPKWLISLGGKFQLTYFPCVARLRSRNPNRPRRFKPVFKYFSLFFLPNLSGTGQKRGKGQSIHKEESRPPPLWPLVAWVRSFYIQTRNFPTQKPYAELYSLPKNTTNKDINTADSTCLG